MEITFEKTEKTWLETVSCQTQCPELNQEIRLGDEMADVKRVLGTWAQPILRGKEWYGDSVSVTGGMMVWVLYEAEGEAQPQTADCWIPFNCKFSLPEVRDTGNVITMPWVRFAETRLSSPRKLTVRVGLALLTEALCPGKAEICTPGEQEEQPELLKKACTAALPMEAGEQTVNLEEELPVPEGCRLVSASLYPQLVESRVLGEKAALRGNGHLRLLVLDKNGMLTGLQFPLAFSQIVDLNTDYGAGAGMEAKLTAANLETELTGDRLMLRCSILVQYTVLDNVTLEVVEDAYLPGHSVELHRQTLTVSARRELRQEHFSGSQQLKGTGGTPVDVRLWMDVPRQHREETEVTVSAQILCYDRENHLQSLQGKWETQANFMGAGSLRLWPVGCPQLRAESRTEGMTLEYEAQWHCAQWETQSLSMVTGLTLGEKEASRGGPSIIVRRAAGSGLWELAKSHGSTMAAIRSLNHLPGEAEEGAWLLIPVQG